MMENMNNDVTVHEAVGVFEKPDDLHAAMDELQENGFMQQELGVLSDDKTVEKKRGYSYSDIREAEDDPQAPRAIFIPDEIISELAGVVVAIPVYFVATITAGFVALAGHSMQTTVAAVAAACIFTAIFGTYFAFMLRKWRIQRIQSHLDKGGLALWVHLRSPEQAARARLILAKHDAKDVHFHEIPLHG